MHPETMKPRRRAPDGASEVIMRGSSIASEATPNPVELQVSRLVRRFGLAPSTAAAVATLAYTVGGAR